MTLADELMQLKELLDKGIITQEEFDAKKKQMLSMPDSYFNGSMAAAVSADAGSFGWVVLGFCFPIIGFILYLVWKDTKPISSKQSGKGALIGFIVGFVCSVIYMFAVMSVMM